MAVENKFEVPRDPRKFIKYEDAFRRGEIPDLESLEEYRKLEEDIRANYEVVGEGIIGPPEVHIATLEIIIRKLKALEKYRAKP